MEGRGGGRTERGEDVPEPVLEGLGVSYGGERCESAYDDEHGVCVGKYVVELYTVQQSIGRQKIHYTRQRASLGDISMPVCGSGGEGPPYNPFRPRTTQISLVLVTMPSASSVNTLLPVISWFISLLIPTRNIYTIWRYVPFPPGRQTE